MLERLVLADQANSHVIVSLFEEGTIGRRLVLSGLEVHSIGMPRRGIPGPGALLRLTKAIRRANCDVLQTWMYHPNLLAGILGKALGIRAICWNIRRTSMPTSQCNRRTRWIATACARLSRLIPDRIICCAASAAREHEQVGYDRERMVVIPNGTDLTRLRPDVEAGLELRTKLHLSADIPLVGCVGRFHPDKDHKALFHALSILRKEHPGVKCVLAGLGTDESNQALVNLARAAGVYDCIVCLGVRQDIAAIMNMLDIHLLSSVTEGFPNVLVEAMACGTPCVSTDVGDARLIIGDCGWLVPVGSPERLAEVTSTALHMRSTAYWGVLQKNCRIRCEKLWALPQMVDAYKGVWAEVARCNGELA